MNLIYNTAQQDIILKEYGRSIQQMVERTCEVADRDQRNRMAQAIIELMRQITTKDMTAQDALNKLWDDLFIMSNFKLDVDSPFPIPTAEALAQKPERLPYPHNHIRYKHYGLHVSDMLKKVVDMTESAEKRYAFIQVARLMKHFYTTWNREIVADDTILENIETIIGRELPDEWISSIKEEGQLDFSEREKRNASYNHQQAQSLANLEDNKKRNRNNKRFRSNKNQDGKVRNKK